MGGSESKTTVKNLSKQITSISESVISNCVVDDTQSQSVDIINSGFQFGNSTRISQSTTIKNECFSSADIQNKLQNSIMDRIAQTTTASGISVLSAFGNSKAVSSANLKNIIQSNVTLKNIQNTYNSIRQGQQVTIENSGWSFFNTVDLSQGSQVFALSTLKEIQKTGILNTISEFVDQKTKAVTASPFQVFADIINGIFSDIEKNVFFFIAFIAFISIAVGAIFVFKSQATK